LDRRRHRPAETEWLVEGKIVEARGSRPAIRWATEARSSRCSKPPEAIHVTAKTTDRSRFRSARLASTRGLMLHM
jgi:hypothetical protein